MRGSFGVWGCDNCEFRGVCFGLVFMVLELVLGDRGFYV